MQGRSEGSWFGRRYDEGKCRLCHVGGEFRLQHGLGQRDITTALNIISAKMIIWSGAHQSGSDVVVPPRACRVSKILIITHDSLKQTLHMSVGQQYQKSCEAKYH
jgi:hypothetical protein